MRIELDSSVCAGYGRCYALAPSIFEADDDGYGSTSLTVVPSELEADAMRGVANCPEGAIRVSS